MGFLIAESGVVASSHHFDVGSRYSQIADAMTGVPENIIESQLVLFDQVHPDYGSGVRKAINKS